MAGMRDKLSHDYFGVNLPVVWKTLQQDLPALKTLMAKVLSDEEAAECDLEGAVTPFMG